MFVRFVSNLELLWEVEEGKVIIPDSLERSFQASCLDRDRHYGTI